MGKEIKGLRKRECGSWIYQKQIDGRRFSLTFDHKPSQKEIDAALFEKRKEAPSVTIKNSFRECANEYIASKSNVLSPSTINAYRSILRNLSDSFCGTSLDHITALTIQREINTYSVNRSPKSVKNASGFITVVMWAYKPDMPIRTKLPQAVKTETYIPTDDEAQKLMDALKGSKYECVILLCMMGLRRSEAIAVTADDLNGNILTIDKAIVVNDQNEYVEKTTKTTSSTRSIFLPPYLVNLLKTQGKAYDGFPGNILRELHRVQDRIGVPRCKLHALRHYYVSMAHSMGVPDAYIMEAVGHSSIETTRNIYLHAQKDKSVEMQKKVANSLFCEKKKKKA